MKMQTKVTVKKLKQLVVNVAVGDSRVRVVAVYKYSSGFSTLLLFCIIYLYLMIIREIYTRARARVTFGVRTNVRVVARALLKERNGEKKKEKKKSPEGFQKKRKKKKKQNVSRGPYVTRVVSPPGPAGSGGGFLFFFFLLGFSFITVFVNREESREY